MTEPPTDRPNTVPWLEDVQHLAVVLDSLEQQAIRAVEGGVPAADIMEALAPLDQRLSSLASRISYESLVHGLGLA